MAGLRYPQQRLRNIMREFRDLADAAEDVSPIWPKVGDYLSRTTRAQFATRGRRSGHLWKPLADSTVREKRREGWPRTPLVRTGEMKYSLVGRPMEVEVYHKRTATFGTNNEKARWQHYGTFNNGKRHIPPRKIVVLTKKDKVEIALIIHRYLKRRMRGV